MIFIFHHLGMGDSILCNGMVREIAKYRDQKFCLFVKVSYLETVRFMYKDLPNVYFYAINASHDEDLPIVKDFIKNNNRFHYILTGILGNGWGISYDHYDELIYKQVNISYDKKWSSFFVARNIEREKQFFKLLNVKENEYNFYHDDINRGFIIRNEYKKGSIITPNMLQTSNMFDWCYTIENAKEVHCIDSSFRCLVEHLNPTGELFYHQYARFPYGWNTPFSRKNWKVYE